MAGAADFVIKQAIPRDIVTRLNEVFDAVQGEIGEEGHMPPFPSGNALHWDESYRWLLDNPVVSPIIEQLVGGQPDREYPSFRIDHVNVHNWCNPAYIAKHGHPGTTLHGGWKGTGGSQFFR